MSYDDELLNEFVAESREHLDTIEPDLLAMESEGAKASQEVLNSVFRAIHSIKGAAGFFAFESLKKLSHMAENVLMPIRDGELEITPDVMDALLAAVDKLRVMVDDIHASEDVPCQEELSQLESLLGGDEKPATKAKGKKGSKKSAKTKAKTKLDTSFMVEFDIDCDKANAACDQGKSIFQITVNLRDDLHSCDLTPEAFSRVVLELGEILAMPAGLAGLEKRLEEDISFSFIMASVLEQSLLAPAMSLPFEQVLMLKAPPAASSETSSEEVTPESITGKKLGEILIMMGVQKVHIAWGLRKQLDGDSRRIGDILVDAGFTSADLCTEAFRMQSESKALAAEKSKSAIEKSKPKPKDISKSKPKSKSQPARADGNETLRVKVDLLTSLMNTASELVLGRNQLLSVLEEYRDEVPGLPAILQNVDHVTSELQEGVMQTRMQPVGAVFGKFTRVVRDMAKKLGKKIQLQTEGGDVELDKSVIELLGDPLTHIVRNCADHALETPDQREAYGKDGTGTILLRAYHEGGQVNISIADDGRGIDAARIREKAIEKGVITDAQANKMTENEIVRLVFAPGFSTAEKVTDVSGRGVGMDVVRTNIEKLGGHIDIETAVGKGTTVLLRLPLTLAIVPALVVGIEDLRFAVPQVNLVELVRVKASEIKERIESVHGADVLRLRGRLLPLVRLTDVLAIERTYKEPLSSDDDIDENNANENGSDLDHADRREAISDRRSGSENTSISKLDRVKSDRDKSDRRSSWQSDYNILVLQIGANQFGVIVEKLFDSEEIVVKPLSTFVKGCESFSGSTIMGDGKVIMILDVGGLANKARLRFASIADEEKRRQDEHQAINDAAAASRRSIILFDVADGDLFAVAQDKILRLERIVKADIEQMGGSEFIKYRGKGLPLLRLDRQLPVNAISPEIDELFLIIPKHFKADGSIHARAGIIASRIVDALDVEVVLQEATVKVLGIEGSAIVGDHLTMFLDPVKLVDGVLGSDDAEVAA